MPTRMAARMATRLATRLATLVRRPARLILPLLTVAALAGCTPPTRFAPACPSLALLPDGADLIRFDGHGKDATNLVLAAHLVAVPAICSKRGATSVKAQLHVTATVTTGPAAHGTIADLPYFIAVLKNNQVVDRQAFTLPVRLSPAGQPSLVQGKIITLDLPETAADSAAGYAIYVSFQLSRDELAFNRAQHTR